jgi:hypothetical protein
MLPFLLGLSLLGAGAQAAPDRDDPGVRVVATEGQPLPADALLELELTRPLNAPAERLAVLVGAVDWSGLFVTEGVKASARPGLARLPAGPSIVTVYIVTGTNDWHAIASLPIRVARPARFERAELAPKTDVTNAGQIAEVRQPDAGAAERARFQDITVSGGLRSQHVRNGVSVTTQLNLVGVSNQSTALRFGLEGAAAPRIDLADYAATIETSQGRAAVGHLTFTSHRHLVNGLASRGITVAARRARADITAAVLNGNSVVGFSNLLGLATPANQVSFVVVGAELVGGRPGGGRFEVSLVDGARLPLSGFNQGQVNDTERSRGAGLRFVASDSAQRFRIDTGVARSRFTNPVDPLLARGVALVPVRDQTDDAQYLDASYDVVRTAIDGVPIVATTTYRFERVDPLFRSVGLPQAGRSDLLEHVVELTTTVGPLAGQITHSRSHDNLGNVASILTTDSSVTGASLTLPLSSIGSRPRLGLPAVSYTLNRSRQVGLTLPPAGGFISPSQVPDQLNLVQSIRADWTLTRWGAAYALNHTFQDNRQEERENSDFANQVHAVSVQFRPGTRVDLSADLGFERASNIELAQIGRTWRLGLIGNWRLATRSLLTANLTRTQTGDAIAVASVLRDLTVQFTQDLAFPSRAILRPKAQAFGRLSWQSSSSGSGIGAVREVRQTWSVATGLTLTVF